MENKMNDIQVKISSMGIVFVKKNVNDTLVLILKCDGEWVFPKGHIEKGETLVEAACREIKEESGVIVKKEECLGLIDEFSFYFEGEKAIKAIKVHLFVINELQNIIYNIEEEFTDGRWVTVQEALNLLAHDTAKNALQKAVNVLNN